MNRTRRTNDSEALSDEQLLNRVCKGEHQAFAELVRRHTKGFTVLACRTLNSIADAEDIVQSAFIKLWHSPTVFDPTRAKFTTWFYRTIINACRDHLRRQQTQDNYVRRIEQEDILRPQYHVDECERMETGQHAHKRRKQLEVAIRELPQHQQDVLHLVVFCALPQKQVAEILGFTVKAVESHLVRAKRRMRESVLKQSRLQTGSVCDTATNDHVSSKTAVRSQL